MKRLLQSLCVSVVLSPGVVLAEVTCTISDFQIEAYDHSGTYMHGKVNGAALVSFLNLCGKTSGAQDCNSRATDRRLAIALAAQAQGKSLLAYFEQFSSCAQVQPYAIVTGLRTSH